MLDQLLTFIALFAWFWFAFFLVLVVLRGYRMGGVRGGVRAFLSWRVVFGLTIAIALSLLSASLVFIEPQEVGVVISFISPDGYREQPLRSGLRFIVPLAERVVRYPIYWQTYTMSSDPLEGEKVGNDSISARTSDGQIVYLDCTVIYRLDANEAVRIHIDLQDRYIKDFIRPVMRGVIRTEVSQFTADEVNSSKRKNLEENLGELLREALSDKGFVLDRFLLRNITFSPQYASAIEQKQVAEQEQTQREYQAEQMRKLAEGERDKMKIEVEGKAAAIEREAQARATAVVVQAQAEAEAIQKVRQALGNDQNYILLRYVDKISGAIKVMLVPSDNPFLLPLPDLNQLEELPGETTPLTTTLGIPLGTPILIQTPTPTPTLTPTPEATATPTPGTP